MEGIEPSSLAYETTALPLCYIATLLGQAVSGCYPSAFLRSASRDQPHDGQIACLVGKTRPKECEQTFDQRAYDPLLVRKPESGISLTARSSVESP
jgi:hypothetical protein